MIKIFILEDDENRIDFFKRFFSKKYSYNEYKIYQTDNVEKAKQLYSKNEPFNLLLLDHDLDQKQMVESTETNTGYQFAKWLKAFYENTLDKTQIIVHSMNPIGTDDILKELNKAERIPFPVLVKVLQEYN